MIRIRKPKKAPAVLRQKGKKAAALLCAAYDAAPAKYVSGERTFKGFDRAIYAAKTVKHALLRAQHGKCAFCESQITAVSYGDVEHLRPKAGFKQNEGDSLGRPGYYWLAYAWGNLFLSCAICNQRFKRNLFPLGKPDRRARCHRHRLSREAPLLVDPGKDDPEEFLTFDGEYAVAVDGNSRGQTTIEVLGLNREELADKRRMPFLSLQTLLDVRRCLVQHLGVGTATDEDVNAIHKIDLHIEEQQRDQAEYAAMVRAAIARARTMA